MRGASDVELHRLRELLRELVALSDIPGVWLERAARESEAGTEAVASALADALVALLGLDFAFVRLREPDGGGAVDVTRGEGWPDFPRWLERRQPVTRREIVEGADAPGPSPGFATPIGRGGEAGVLAAARDRVGFPTATEVLLLSLAANQAATAFQGARLVRERIAAEAALREGQRELELRVAQRTAELRRSEAYLAEAQRLTHTGSFAIDARTRELVHSSAEHTRLYGFDPAQGRPSLAAFLKRIDPGDRVRCVTALEAGIRDAASIDLEYRAVLPSGEIRQHRAIGHPVAAASGEYGGTVVDVTERREAEAELKRLAAEQAALRRVATLVARGAAPPTVFDAVAAETAALLDADGVAVCRYEPEGELTVVAHRGPHAALVPPGSRTRPDRESVSAVVRRTGRAARSDSYAATRGDIGARPGGRSGVGAPILVDGRLWGVTVATWADEEPPPAGTEERMAQFAELLDTAIGNADSRDQLMASRARLVAAADEARRRVVRDLHDGAQQRLVHTIVTLELALQACGQPGDDVEPLVREALENAKRSIEVLRELAHGILPRVLAQGGLRAGVDEVVARLDLPVAVDIPAIRFAQEIEASAYFVVAEALTNVFKHSRARNAEVRASVTKDALHVDVRDDGVGGADLHGHGLVGLGDRVTALGGRLVVESPPGGGTHLSATLPLSA